MMCTHVRNFEADDPIMHPASPNTAQTAPVASVNPNQSGHQSSCQGRILVCVRTFVIGLAFGIVGILVPVQPAFAQLPVPNVGIKTVPPMSVWPKREFKLPVEIAPAGMPPSELQLFVAQPSNQRAGGGPDWKLVSRKPFPADHFDFVSPQDGTYWFAIRTLDASGLSSPANLRPDVAIYVDTHEPKVVINAESDDQGTVRGEVLIQDATAIRQFQLQYHTDDAAAWTVLPPESVRVVQSDDGRGDRRAFEFTPDGEWRRLTVRASAADSANHVSHLNQLIERPRLAAAALPRYAANMTAVPARVASSPVQNGNAAHNNRPIQNRLPITRNMSAVPPAGYSALAVATPQDAASSANTLPLGQSPFGTPSVSETIPTPPAVAVPESRLPTPAFGQAPGNASTFGNPTLLNAPVTNGLDPSNGPPVTGPGSTAGQIDDSSNIQWNSKLEPSESRWDPARVMNSPRTVEDALRPLTPREVKPQPEQTRDGQLHSDDTAYSASRIDTRATADLASQNAPVRYSDSPRFSLEYELEAVGSSGADAIELWGSTDGGTSWTKWGEDPDRASPFDIETKGDGVFGFRIVVLGGNGLNSPAPRSGESADINVVVDQQKPETRITGAQYGDGDAIGCLVIRYECIDDFLATRPVTLAFSATADGPWTTIAGGLRNDGQYIWPADPGLPPQMYLRITATDKAGNVGSFQLDRPIDTQGLAPRARIRGFQILSNRGSATSPEDQTAERPRAAFK